MTGRARITVNIGTLRVAGASRAEAAALAEALRTGLAGHLSADPAALRPGGVARLSLSPDGGAAGGPGQRGAAIGRQIGTALSRPNVTRPSGGG